MNLILRTAAAGLSAFAINATAAPVTYFGEDLNVFAQSGAVIGTTPNATAARNSFFSNLSGVGTQTFETFADGTGAPLALVFPGAGSATLNGGGSVDNDPGTGQNATSGSNWWRTGSGNDFIINFTAPVAAFGFFGIDVGDIGSQLTLTLASGAPVAINIPHTLDVSNGAVFYFGYIDDANPFTSATFSNPGSGDDFGFDDMTIGSQLQVVPPGGSVPEPGSLALLGAALGAFGLSRRRKKA